MTVNRYLLHSELPQPILFKDKDTSLGALQDFITTYGPIANKFTIDDDNVGRGVLCAFLEDSIQGIMVYSKKDRMQEYMIRQGFQCRLQDSNLKPLIECQKI